MPYGCKPIRLQTNLRQTHGEQRKSNKAKPFQAQYIKSNT